jgi:hypothetical protein
MGGMGGQFDELCGGQGLRVGVARRGADFDVDVLTYMVGTTATPSLLASLPSAAGRVKRMRIQSPEECLARLLRCSTRAVAFPSDEHEAGYYAYARGMATVNMPTAPPGAKKADRWTRIPALPGQVLHGLVAQVRWCHPGHGRTLSRAMMTA